MTYYSEDKIRYLIDGVEVYMTEAQAEHYQSTHPDADIQSFLTEPIPEEEQDDLLDCTCQPDPPEGTAPLCASCRKYFESLLEDE